MARCSNGVRTALALTLTLAVGACGGPSIELGVLPLDAHADSLSARLLPLRTAIGDRRVVLIGENGHGVGEHTRLKVELVEWLHRDLGFDVIAMESGYFECGHAWRRIENITPRRALYDCLRYPFQHAEVLPLFERIAEQAGGETPLVLAGVDPQAQGFDSEPRPWATSSYLADRDPELARRVAALDSALFLPEASGGLGDAVYPWILARGEEARAVYEAAAERTTGWERWVFQLAVGWVDRVATRARAEAEGLPRPPRYYELRDEWMARAVVALADSIAERRKVVVWLHNDHARYGDFEVGESRVRSVGGYLQGWLPDDVFSIGLFMGSGTIADNSRNERTMRAVPSGGIEEMLGTTGADRAFLLLSGNRDEAIRAWADGERPYLRAGLDERSLVPGEEFDALFYVESVSPPTYAIPGG